MMLDEMNSAITQLTARSPSLFKRLPERIFAPLASANRGQYWHLLCALYDKRFGPDAPLPPGSGFLMREITHDIAEEMQHQEWVLEEFEATPLTPLANRANAVFNRLRDSGWLRVERLGVRDMVSMPPAVAHFMNRLIEFAHTGPEFVSGKIRSIEANLKVLLHENADGASLQEAARQSRALLEHIRIASTNVRDLMREIGDIEATGEFVRRFFDDYVERIFIADYKELRTREHPLAVISGRQRCANVCCAGIRKNRRRVMRHALKRYLNAICKRSKNCSALTNTLTASMTKSAAPTGKHSPISITACALRNRWGK